MEFHNWIMDRFIPWSRSLLDLSVISSILFIIFSIYLSLRLAKLEKAVKFFSLFFLITLLPFLNIIPLNAQMAEHWLYLPSIGFFAVLAWGGDGGTFDIGIQALSGAAERGDNILYVC